LLFIKLVYEFNGSRTLGCNPLRENFILAGDKIDSS